MSSLTGAMSGKFQRTTNSAIYGGVSPSNEHNPPTVLGLTPTPAWRYQSTPAVENKARNIHLCRPDPFFKAKTSALCKSDSFLSKGAKLLLQLDHRSFGVG